MTVNAAVQAEIEKTILALKKKEFKCDPIAGEEYSKITSVMSSAYKRHGFILERAILEAVAAQENFEAWEDRSFHVTSTADSIANTFLGSPAKAIKSEVPYEEPGERTLQIDLFAYNRTTKHLAGYEIKRGSGLHDAGKRRQILRDLICLELLLKSYGEQKGLDVTSSRAHIIFYYGECSVSAPFAIKGDELDSHFGFEIKSVVEEVNAEFKSRLVELIKTT